MRDSLTETIGEILPSYRRSEEEVRLNEGLQDNEVIFRLPNLVSAHQEYYDYAVIPQQGLDKVAMNGLRQALASDKNFDFGMYRLGTSKHKEQYQFDTFSEPWIVSKSVFAASVAKIDEPIAGIDVLMSYDDSLDLPKESLRFRKWQWLKDTKNLWVLQDRVVLDGGSDRNNKGLLASQHKSKIKRPSK